MKHKVSKVHSAGTIEDNKVAAHALSFLSREPILRNAGYSIGPKTIDAARCSAEVIAGNRWKDIVLIRNRSMLISRTGSDGNVGIWGHPCANVALISREYLALIGSKRITT
jgi:hypothetical protein